ncbi:MAG: MarR family transcriptional regulator [Clostridiales bacterium]|nr:MarR family transcriptional regulator [Clostridiales bacterium]
MNSQPINEENKFDILKLDNQLCFSLYVCSKEIIRKYKTLLEPYGLTYTGYIIMMALWEEDHITIKNLGEKLFLDSGTLTPLLKKLEAQEYIVRNRSKKDERNVYISLTKKGKDLRSEALCIPEQLISTLDVDMNEGKQMLDQLHKLMKILTQ